MEMIEQDNLEYFVDQYGLDDVLESLARICYEKANHLESDWQDRITARVWRKAAKRLELVNTRIAV
jgi:hypothetical protein